MKTKAVFLALLFLSSGALALDMSSSAHIYVPASSRKPLKTAVVTSGYSTVTIMYRNPAEKDRIIKLLNQTPTGK